MSEYKRLTEKTKDCFQYDLKDFKHKIGEFGDYDAFFAYSMAVKRLGEIEDKIENGTLVPKYSIVDCGDTLKTDACELITEQEKEIEQLTEERNRYAETLAKYQMASDKEIRAQKKQAVKEFAEKLKEKALLHCRTINCYECKFIETTIDELLEERK